MRHAPDNAPTTATATEKSLASTAIHGGSGNPPFAPVGAGARRRMLESGVDRCYFLLADADSRGSFGCDRDVGKERPCGTG